MTDLMNAIFDETYEAVTGTIEPTPPNTSTPIIGESGFNAGKVVGWIREDGTRISAISGEEYRPTAADLDALEEVRRLEACEEIFAFHTADPRGYVDRLIASGDTIDDIEFAASQVIDEGMALAGYRVLGKAA